VTPTLAVQTDQHQRLNGAQTASRIHQTIGERGRGIGVAGARFYGDPGRFWRVTQVDALLLGLLVLKLRIFV
jgi:adenylosuccinate synthase